MAGAGGKAQGDLGIFPTASGQPGLCELTELLLLPLQRTLAAAGRSWKAKESLWLTSTPSWARCRRWLLPLEGDTGKGEKFGIDPKKLGAAQGCVWDPSRDPVAQQGASPRAGCGICSRIQDPHLALLENGENSRPGLGEPCRAGAARGSRQREQPGPELATSLLQVTKRGHEGTAPPQALGTGSASQSCGAQPTRDPSGSHQ